MLDVGQGKIWPNQVFAPFVDVTAWPPLNISQLYETIHVPYFNLGFIVSKSPTVFQATWGTYYPLDQGPLNAEIKKLRDSGGDVAISFGGASNVPLQVTAPTADALYEEYKNVVDMYSLTRIDFDIEGQWASTAYNNANTKNSKALKKLQDYYNFQGKNIDVWFTLAVLPSGLTADGLNVLKIAIDEGVNIAGVNVMTMDYGDYAAPNPEGQMGKYGIDAIQALHSQLNILYNGSKSSEQLWLMIGTTPMIGVNDVKSEVFTQTDAHQTLDFAVANQVGMISMWSSNRDNTAGSGIVQTPNEFQKIFNAYNNSQPYASSNGKPVLLGVENVTINLNDSFDPLTGITATDPEDGDITSKITVSGTVDTTKAAAYTINYSVTDSQGLTTTKVRVVTVKDPNSSVVTNPNGTTTTEPPKPFDPNAIYTVGQVVIYNNKEYVAKWWTQGTLPGNGGAWEEVVAKNPDGSVPYTPGKSYVAGDIVIYNGTKYQAAWWTDKVPGTDPAWKVII